MLTCIQAIKCSFCCYGECYLLSLYLVAAHFRSFLWYNSGEGGSDRWEPMNRWLSGAYLQSPIHLAIYIDNCSASVKIIWFGGISERFMTTPWISIPLFRPVHLTVRNEVCLLFFWRCSSNLSPTGFWAFSFLLFLIFLWLFLIAQLLIVCISSKLSGVLR